MASHILDDIDIPRDLLKIFEQCDIGVFELLTISVDELQEHLQPTGVSWCYDNLFSRIDSWRKRNKIQILNLLLNKQTLQEPSDKDPSQSSTVKSEHGETKRSNEVTLCQESQPEVLEETSAESVEGEQTLLSAEESQLSADLPEKIIEQSTSEQIPQPGEESRSVPENTAEKQPATLVSEDDLTGDEGEDLSTSVQSQPDRRIPVLTTLNPKWLRNLLLSTEKGKDIIRRSELGELSEAKQQQLAEIVANYHLSLNRNLRSEDLEAYSLAITTLFKSEKKENYYIPRGGDRKNPGGKISNKIGNLKQKRRKEDAREDEHAKKFKPSSEPIKVQAINEGTQWLILNVQPWSLVVEKWPTSFSFRQSFLQKQKQVPKLLQKFPHYKNEFGYQLIDLDFALLFPHASNGLDKLKAVCTGAKPFIEKRASDPSATGLLKHFDSPSEDTRVCAFLLALNTVLPPISAGFRYKPTISVAQEDTVIFAKSVEEAVSKIQTIYSAYAERNLPVVPKLVALGDDLNRMVGRFFVYYGDIHYELPSATRALDVLIKLTAVLGLPYSKQSKLVWYAISDIVYNITQRESYASCVKLRKNLTAIEPSS